MKTQKLARTNTAFNPEVIRHSRRKTCPQGEAVNTVPITQCPNYVDRRFEAPAGFVGEMGAEWKRLRGEV